MGMEKEKRKKLKAFLPTYQVSKTLMKHAKNNAVFLHCLPATRGQEVSKEIIDGNNSLIWKQVENKLHMHKALLHTMLK